MQAAAAAGKHVALQRRQLCLPGGSSACPAPPPHTSAETSGPPRAAAAAGRGQQVEQHAVSSGSGGRRPARRPRTETTLTASCPSARASCTSWQAPRLPSLRSGLPAERWCAGAAKPEVAELPEGSVAPDLNGKRGRAAKAGSGRPLFPMQRAAGPAALLGVTHNLAVCDAYYSVRNYQGTSGGRASQLSERGSTPPHTSAAGPAKGPTACECSDSPYRRVAPGAQRPAPSAQRHRQAGAAAAGSAPPASSNSARWWQQQCRRSSWSL